MHRRGTLFLLGFVLVAMALGEALSPSAPVSAPPSAQTASGYFEGYEPSGVFFGIATSSDPYSGRPFLAYKIPGEGTTTDFTRTAPKTNPELAAAQPRADFENERMPSSASEAIRKASGATSGEELDHRMALALGGSNAAQNLLLIPTTQNQAAGKGEGAMSAEVAAGEISLFDAQVEEAQSKGLAMPFVDAPLTLWQRFMRVLRNETCESTKIFC